MLDSGGRRLKFGKAAARMGREPAVEELLVGGKRRLNLQRLIKAQEFIAGAQDLPPGKPQQALRGGKRDGERIYPSAVSSVRGRGNFFPPAGWGAQIESPARVTQDGIRLRGAALPDYKVPPGERLP